MVFDIFNPILKLWVDFSSRRKVFMSRPSQTESGIMPPRFVGAYYLPPPPPPSSEASANFLHNDLLCNGGGVIYWGPQTEKIRKVSSGSFLSVPEGKYLSPDVRSPDIREFNSRQLCDNQTFLCVHVQIFVSSPTFMGSFSEILGVPQNLNDYFKFQIFEFLKSLYY